MAQTLSTLVSNMTSDVRAANNAKLLGVGPQELVVTHTVPDTSDADIVVMAPISVDAVLSEVELTVADLGSAGSIDIGFYTPNFSGSSVTFVEVDKDAIANNIDVTTANANALAPQRFASLTEDASDKKVWEIAGFTARPAQAVLFIGFSTDTGTTAAGTATLRLKYTV